MWEGTKQHHPLIQISGSDLVGSHYITQLNFWHDGNGMLCMGCRITITRMLLLLQQLSPDHSHLVNQSPACDITITWFHQSTVLLRQMAKDENYGSQPTVKQGKWAPDLAWKSKNIYILILVMRKHNILAMRNANESWSYLLQKTKSMLYMYTFMKLFIIVYL